jgi:hypothetical protein
MLHTHTAPRLREMHGYRETNQKATLTFVVDLWTAESTFAGVYRPVALDELTAVSTEKAQVLGRLMRRRGHFARDD